MRAHLEALAKGGVVPNLSSRDLKTLPIVLPSAEDRSRVEEAFARRQALYDEIDHIEAEIKALQKGTWPQNELRLNEGDDA
jgi:restriction endonuclease S subunit